MLPYFQDFFSVENITAELCKQRVALAARRSRLLFLRRVRTTANRLLDHEQTELDQIFPPRKLWHKFRPKRRNNIPTGKLNQYAILRAVEWHRRRAPQTAWLGRLDDRVDKIRCKALCSKPFEFAKPTIRATEKDKEKLTFRPISSFNGDDKIVEILTARYLRQLLDKVLLPSCLAFRVAAPDEKASDMPTTQLALEKILRMNRRHRPGGLYVAECDIRAFFDCVGHDLARESLAYLSDKRAPIDPDGRLDPRAKEIFDAYLESYDFRGSVLDRSKEILRGLPEKSHFPWPEKELGALWGGVVGTVGVPQGGAISCFIANAVLHRADERLHALDKPRHRFRYMRYCDDMVILAAKEGVCADAFALYQDSLREMKLPIHPPPKTMPRYQGTLKKEFWRVKSKAPYHWARPDGTGAPIPWIQFVGYQVRWDGCVRIRPSSMKRHLAKLRSQTDNLLFHIRDRSGTFMPGVKKGRCSVENRLSHRLLSLSVGRKKRDSPSGKIEPMCWAFGFRGLKGKKIIPAQLKILDRFRERQLRRMRRALDGLEVESSPAQGPREDQPRYFGHPFSYYGQFRPKR